MNLTKCNNSIKFGGIFLLIVLLSSGVAIAEYPEKPVTVIVSYSAGGGTDLLTRTLFPYVEEKLGEQFIVENHPGGGGQIGITKLSQSEPDGYTIGNSNTGQLVMELTRPTAFKIREDFEPIAQVEWDPYGVFVPADSPFNNVEELIKYAKENPDTPLSWGGRTRWDTHYLTMALLELQSGLDFEYVPFDGMAETRSAILGGHITVTSGGMSEFAPLVQEGKLKCIGLASEERAKLLPDSKTFAEQGYNIITGATRGYSAPAGVSQEKIDILVNAIRDVVNNNEGFKAKAKKLGFYNILSFKGGEDYKEFIDNFNKSMKDTISEIESDALVNNN